MTQTDARSAIHSPRDAPKAKHWGEVATFFFAHLAAMLSAGVCAVVVPLLLFTLATAGLLAVAVVTDGDLGGPLFYPAGALVIALAGGATFVLVSVLGVSADLLRRWLRWPLWSPLAAVGVACALGVVSARTLSDFDPRGALAIGALGFAAFASYWLPLALFLGARRMLRPGGAFAPR